MDNPHDIMGPQFIAQLRAQLPKAEEQLALARKQYDLAARAGIANGDMSQRIAEAERKVAQLRAVFNI